MQKLEFWILTQVGSGVQAVFVQIVEENKPEPYYYEPQGEYPVVQFEMDKCFSMYRLPDSQEVYLVHVTNEAARPTYIRDAIHATAQRLLEGTDPAVVLDELLEIQADPRFRADCLAFYVCGKFLYTLGLTYELLGQNDLAVANYMYLWRDFPTSPYTVMGRRGHAAPGGQVTRQVPRWDCEGWRPWRASLPGGPGLDSKKNKGTFPAAPAEPAAVATSPAGTTCDEAETTFRQSSSQCLLKVLYRATAPPSLRDTLCPDSLSAATSEALSSAFVVRWA